MILTIFQAFDRFARLFFQNRAGLSFVIRKDYELLLQDEGSTNAATFIDLWVSEVRSGSRIEMNAVLRGADAERHICPSCTQPHCYAVLDQEKYTKW